MPSLFEISLVVLEKKMKDVKSLQTDRQMMESKKMDNRGSVKLT